MALSEPDRHVYYEKPNYPNVPHSEYKVHIGKAQQLMAENNVDCLALWSRKNIRYFFGFQSIHWKNLSIQPSVGIIPLRGEPVLIIPEFFTGGYRRMPLLDKKCFGTKKPT